jgi:hypothetical protein
MERKRKRERERARARERQIERGGLRRGDEAPILANAQILFSDEVGVRGDVGVIQSTNAPGSHSGSESLASAAATKLMSSFCPRSGWMILRCALAVRSKNRHGSGMFCTSASLSRRRSSRARTSFAAS